MSVVPACAPPFAHPSHGEVFHGIPHFVCMHRQGRGDPRTHDPPGSAARAERFGHAFGQSHRRRARPSRARRSSSRARVAEPRLERTAATRSRSPPDATRFGMRLFGYSSGRDSATITAGQTTTLNFVVQRAAATLEAVTTLGTRGQERTVIDAPVPIDVLSVGRDQGHRAHRDRADDPGRRAELQLSAHHDRRRHRPRASGNASQPRARSDARADQREAPSQQRARQREWLRGSRLRAGRSQRDPVLDDRPDRDPARRRRRAVRIRRDRRRDQRRAQAERRWGRAHHARPDGHDLQPGRRRPRHGLSDPARHALRARRQGLRPVARLRVELGEQLLPPRRRRVSRSRPHQPHASPIRASSTSPAIRARRTRCIPCRTAA